MTKFALPFLAVESLTRVSFETTHRDRDRGGRRRRRGERAGREEPEREREREREEPRHKSLVTDALIQAERV